jgi:hypothetical protein
MSKASIKEIVFNVRGKELKLSSDEAKELKSILEDLFGGSHVVHSHEYIPYQPWSPWRGTFWCNTVSNVSDNLSYTLADGATSGGNLSNTAYLTIT